MKTQHHKLFSDIKVFNPDTLLEDMLEAKEGTLFLLGEKRHPNHEGDDTIEHVFAQIIRTKDTPHKEVRILLLGGRDD